MSPELARSAEIIARVMPSGADWWIIGSAALALSGMDVEPKDIDVFAAADVIEAARGMLGAVAMPASSDRFRSSPYFQFCPSGGLEIDFMGGLQVCTEGAWIDLQIESRFGVECGKVELFVASLQEQARIFRLFGRPKDIKRSALIAKYSRES